MGGGILFSAHQLNGLKILNFFTKYHRHNQSYKQHRQMPRVFWHWENKSEFQTWNEKPKIVNRDFELRHLNTDVTLYRTFIFRTVGRYPTETLHVTIASTTFITNDRDRHREISHIRIQTTKTTATFESICNQHRKHFEIVLFYLKLV